jgi:hypothetical protein
MATNNADKPPLPKINNKYKIITTRGIISGVGTASQMIHQIWLGIPSNLVSLFVAITGH